MSEEEKPANQPEGYEPPEVWTWDTESGGRFASINRPIAGATHEKELPVGEHPHQLYSLATPNGVKVTVMFEELLALGYSDAECVRRCVAVTLAGWCADLARLKVGVVARHWPGRSILREQDPACNGRSVPSARAARGLEFV